MSLRLPFMAEWPDKYDYYVLEIGEASDFSALDAVMDIEYDHYGLGLCVEQHLLRVFGFYGRANFFAGIQLAEPVDMHY